MRLTFSDASDLVVRISARSAYLRGSLSLGSRAHGLVIVANGDGDHVYDETNRYVARRLCEAGFSALVVDLLTPHEKIDDAESSRFRFHERFLASRLINVAQWARQALALRPLEIGLFASGLCGGAALVAGSESSSVRAVVCRGARIDVVVPELRCVRAEVLLLVGERDTAQLRASQDAFRLLPGSANLRVVPDGGHLLDDSVSLEQVVRETRSWFARTLAPLTTRSDV